MTATTILLATDGHEATIEECGGWRWVCCSAEQQTTTAELAFAGWLCHVEGSLRTRRTAPRRRGVANLFNSNSVRRAADMHRRQQRLQWQQVAGASGVHPTTLSNFWTGKTDSPAIALALIHWMGAPVESFMLDRRAT